MKFKITAALIAVYLIWGSTYLGIKIASETFYPFFHGALRFFVSGLVLYLWQRKAGEPKPTAAEWRSASIVGILLLATGNGLVSLAETRIPSGIAALCLATSSIFMVTIDAVFINKRPPGITQTIGLVLGLIGVIYLIDPFKDVDSAGSLSITFTLIGILASFSWSVGSMYSRKSVHPKSVLMYTGMQMISGSLGLFLMSLLSGEIKNFDFSLVTMQSWLAMGYLIVFGSWIGFTSYGFLLKNAPVSLISTYLYVNPVVAIFLGNLIGGEELSNRILISALIILTSIFLINLKPKKPVPTETTA